MQQTAIEKPLPSSQAAAALRRLVESYRTYQAGGDDTREETLAALLVIFGVDMSKGAPKPTDEEIKSLFDGLS